MAFKTISEHDKEQINLLYQQLYPEFKGEVDLTEQSFEAKYLPICLEENGEVIGFIIGTIVKFGTQKYAYIEDLVVREDNRGQGLGIHLVDRLMNQFNEEEIEVVDLTDGQDSADFYKKFGFESCQNPWFCKELKKIIGINFYSVFVFS